MRNWVLVGCVGFVMACWVESSTAQTSELFITTSGTDDIFVVQGGAVIHQWKKVVSTQESPIAVIDTVRTTGNSPGSQGAEYTLDGDDTGERFQHPEGIGTFYDGTTDGVKFNYGVVIDGEEVNRVFRTDLDWANPEVLFAVDRAFMGITFDTTDNTLWLGGFSDEPIIEHRSLDGELLGSFVPKGDLNTGLALDPADDTLWVAEGRGQKILRQYSKDGELLQDLVIGGLNGQTIGAEFQFQLSVPRCLYEVTKVKEKGKNACFESCDELPFEAGDQICSPVECEDKSDCKKKAKFFQGCPNGASVQIKAVLIGCTECVANCSP